MKLQLLFVSLICVQFFGWAEAVDEMMGRPPQQQMQNPVMQQQMQQPVMQQQMQQPPQDPVPQPTTDQQNQQSLGEPRQSGDGNDDRRRGRQCSASNCPGNGGRPRNQCHRFERIVTNNRGERLCVVFPGNCPRPFCFRDPCDRLHQCPRASHCITDPCQPCSAFFYNFLFEEIRC